MSTFSTFPPKKFVRHQHQKSSMIMKQDHHQKSKMIKHNCRLLPANCRLTPSFSTAKEKPHNDLPPYLWGGSFDLHTCYPGRVFGRWGVKLDQAWQGVFGFSFNHVRISVGWCLISILKICIFLLLGKNHQTCVLLLYLSLSKSLSFKKVRYSIVFSVGQWYICGDFSGIYSPSNRPFFWDGCLLPDGTPHACLSMDLVCFGPHCHPKNRTYQGNM